ncbi:MAG TPA: alpha/beta hydrolase [Thermoanaerobaculia bacterium]|nr:alpha/beta hydrolase [Thermoanaerobaculia bacterium]
MSSPESIVSVAGAAAGAVTATLPSPAADPAPAVGPAVETVPVPPRRWRGSLAPLMLAGGIGALGVLRQRFQHGQMFLPERYPNGLWQPQSYGVAAEDVWFSSADGTRLHGWWMPARRARGTVLYCHGNAGNITNRIGAYRLLHRARLNVFAFDYRGYGRSEGRPSEPGVLADARAAHDSLVNEIEESPERILFFGHSLGGAIAIDCALHRRGVGLVVQSSFTNVREMARVRFPSLPMHLVARNQFRSLDKVSQVTIPKLFIHGTADETIPVRLGRRLFEHASDPKEWYEVPHAGHNDVPLHGGLRYLWKLIGFAKRAIRGARA